jgi:hypothetical protein
VVYNKKVCYFYRENVVLKCVNSKTYLEIYEMRETPISILKASQSSVRGVLFIRNAHQKDVVFVEEVR